MPLTPNSVRRKTLNILSSSTENSDTKRERSRLSKSMPSNVKMETTLRFKRRLRKTSSSLANWTRLRRMRKCLTVKSRSRNKLSRTSKWSLTRRRNRWLRIWLLPRTMRLLCFKPTELILVETPKSRMTKESNLPRNLLVEKVATFSRKRKRTSKTKQESWNWSKSWRRTTSRSIFTSLKLGL